ncbi:hypothetical protein EYF80_015682 [Liparis tanakae]|uniref:Uncharacterized protein n=1 Tax=Liparis tanakae TaxID=230148 RepID=A0A4Z2I8A0_9TELE|nr:hypothetical protein EYF80_015682 [Liparis tanakae]
MVWRMPLGGMVSCSTIRLICGSKPMSNMRTSTEAVVGSIPRGSCPVAASASASTTTTFTTKSCNETEAVEQARR